MKYRRLGRSDLNVSVLGIGTYQYGGEWGKTFSQEEVTEILSMGMDNGVNLIDAAECYGDHLAETLIGNAIREKREKWILLTKFGHHFLPNFGREQIWDVKGVSEQLEASLKALKTDYIDIYMFHSPTNDQMLNDDLFAFLQKAKERGLIRSIGLSLKPAVDDNAFQTNYAASHGIDVIEVQYNRLDTKPETLVFPICKENDLGIIARVPLASGLLSGKYSADHEFPKDDCRSVQDHEYLKNRIIKADEIKRKEVPDGVPMSEWAMAWTVRTTAVSAFVAGFKSREQLESGINAVNLSMVP